MQIENCVTSIEKAFFDYLAKRLNEAEFCKRLSKILTSADLNGVSKEFEVSLVDGKANFAGMCVYPDMSHTTRLFPSYGVPNIAKLREQNMAYVDKTSFIRKLEETRGLYVFMVRPRRFGKTMFSSILCAYYLNFPLNQTLKMPIQPLSSDNSII